MKPDFVADVGNSRIKWGRCLDSQVVQSVSVPPEDVPAWQAQRALLTSAGTARWAVAGVHPQRRDRLVEWLRQCGDEVDVLTLAQQLPLRVLVERPDHVGIDRLLDAVAASGRVQRGVAAVLVDAGSAVTVDWLDESGAFAGGAIFPGFRLMTQALHDYTALLPLVKVEDPVPSLPSTSTPTAVAAGVFWAVAGGIQALITQLAARAAGAIEVFLTGGDAALLANRLPLKVHVWPNMTLEGIRIAAEAQP
jgi:type III pantothenate kinase